MKRKLNYEDVFGPDAQYEVTNDVVLEDVVGENKPMKDGDTLSEISTLTKERLSEEMKRGATLRKSKLCPPPNDKNYEITLNGKPFSVNVIPRRRTSQ